MKTALITGANRGIGLELTRQLKKNGYYVIGCCRKVEQAQELALLADEILELDVTQDAHIAQLKKTLANKPIDLLINNAGISGESGVTLGHIDRNNFLNVLNVNCVSALLISDALLSNVQASMDKSILIISSQMGSIADNTTGKSYAYRSSKAALNCAMRSFALDTSSLDIKIMLIHPGWVQTDMGGKNAAVTVPISVQGMLAVYNKYHATSHADILYSYNGDIIPW